MGVSIATRQARAEAAAAKKARGQKLTRDDQRALDWQDRETRERHILEGLRAIPKGLYCQLAARQNKVVDDAATRHGLPLLGATVDLFAAVRAFHDLVAKHAGVLTAAGGADWQQEKLKQQIETLKARRRLLESDIARRRDELIARAEVARRAEWLAGRLRQLAEQLGRRHGRDAQTLANDFFATLASDLEHGPAAGDE